MDFNYSARIDELEKLKERKKILRQIQDSKQRLLYGNPDLIGSFIKEKINHTLLDKEPKYETPTNDYIPKIPIKSPSDYSISKRTPHSNKSKYLDLMKQQRSLIEQELKLMRNDEDKHRKDLERRVKHFIRSNEKKTSKNLHDLRKSMKLLTEHWSDVHTNSQPSDAYNELIKLKRQYIEEGGKDPNLLFEFDEMIAQQQIMQYQTTQSQSLPNNHDWPKKRQDAVFAQKRSNELRDIERQIAELENQLDIEKARSPIPRKNDKRASYNASNSAAHNPQKYQFDELHKQIYELQKEILHLKEEKKDFIRLSPTPRLDVQLEDKLPKKNVIVRLDFVTGSALHIQRVIITSILYIDGNTKTDSKASTDPIDINPVQQSNLNSSFVIDLQHSLMNCPPKKTVFVLIEIKTSIKNNFNAISIGQDDEDIEKEFKTEAWARIPIFFDDESREPRVGKWRQPLYCIPILPDVKEENIHEVPQYHRGFIHYRIGTPSNIVDKLDEPTQDPIKSYKDDKPLVYNKAENPFKVKRFGAELNDDDSDGSDVTVDLDVSPEFGVQVSRVKHVNLTNSAFRENKTRRQADLLAKVHLTVYHTDGRKRGQILMSQEGPVACLTNSVKADFKEACYQFGRQIVEFNKVDLSLDCLIVARVYVHEERMTKTENKDNGDNDALDSDDLEEHLIAWTALPLVKRRSSAKNNQGYVTDNLKLLQINRGLHDLKLYDPPVLPPSMVYFDKFGTIVGQTKYGNAKLKLRIFHTKPVYDSDTSSDEYTDYESESSESEVSKEKPKHHLWRSVSRAQTLTLPYNHDTGFDLYIDSGRLFPDGATLVKIEAKLVDRNMREMGPKMSAVSLLDSDIHNPVFSERYEIRDPDLAPSTTLLLKLTTFDREDKELCLLGFSVLNLFVETGTNHQPKFDNLGILVSLNDQGHQLPIYTAGPEDGEYQFSVNWFKDNDVPVLTGASLLVRLYKPSINRDGRPLNIEEVPENQQRRLGVLIDPPAYEDGFYLTNTCVKPANMDDWRILKQLSRRPAFLLRYLLSSDWAETIKKKAPVSEMLDQKQLYKIFDYFNAIINEGGELNIVKFNTNHIIQYHPEEGFKISIDGALNIPWTGFTFGHISLFPPGAIYMDKPYLIYDRPFFFTKLDFTSSASSPIWLEGWKTYRHRKYDQNLLAIIHIHEMNISTVKNDFKFTLDNEAWIAVPIFDGPYCITNSIQLPLILGGPQYSDLEQLKTMSVRNFLRENLANKNIKLISPASIIVRQCDTRRTKEISITADKDLLPLDQSYLPSTEVAKYTRSLSSKRELAFSDLVPPGFTESTFQELLRVKFRSLIYKYYDENGFNKL